MADFKRDLLTYGGINASTGNQQLRGNVRFFGNGSFLQQLEVDQLSVSGNAVIPGLSFDSLTVSGNVVSGGNFIGNGALMTGVTSTLPTQASLDIVGNVRAPGNVTVAGQVTTTGNVVGQYFIGNGSQLTGLLSSLPATANIDIRGNVTAAGNITASGQVNVIGNIVGQYFLGNGSQLSGVLTSLPTTANIDIRGNVTSSGNVVVAGQVNVTGNVVGQYFLGNGALLTGIAASTLPATANIDIVGNVTAPGNVVVAGQVNVTGNVIGQHLFGSSVTASALRVDDTFYLQLQANNSILAFDSNDYLEYRRSLNKLDVNISGNTVATFDSQGNLSVLGNVIAPFFVGNGYGLTGVTATSLPTRANLDIIGNVTAPGNVVVAGQVNVVGNVVGAYFIGNGSQLTDVALQYTANGQTITTSNLVFATDQYLSVFPSNLTSFAVSTVGVNTGGNLVALSNSGFIQQTNLNGYLVVPQGYVANTQVRLGLSGGNAPIGTLVTQVDSGNSYLLTSPPSNINVNWLEFTGANFPVNTVFGRTGDILAGYGDYYDNYIELSSNVGSTPVGNSVAEALQTLQNTKANIINGNISASYFIGNGALLSGIATSTLPATANIDITGNVTAPGNVNVAGQVNVLGNIVAPFFVGNGAQLTGMSLIQNGTSNVSVVSPGGSVTMMVNGVANVLVVKSNTFEVGRNLIGYGDATFANIANSAVTFGNYTPVVVDNSTGTLRKKPVEVPQLAGDNGFCISGTEGLMFIHKNQLWTSGYGWTVNLEIFGFPQSNPLPSPVTIPTNTPILGFSDYWYHSYNAMALTTDGRVFCWGNQYGPSVANFNPVQVSLPAPAARIYGPLTKSNEGASVTSSATFAATLGNGQLYMWGYNNWGQLGRGTTQASNVIPTIPNGLATANIVRVQIASGYAGMVAALEANGRLWTWGYNVAGECGLGNTDIITVPSLVPGFTNVTDVRCISAYSGLTGSLVPTGACRILLSNGTSFASGWNGFGELADGTLTNRSSFVRENSNRSNIAAIGGLTDSRSSAHYIIQGDGQMLFSGYKPSMGLTANATTTTPFFYNAEGLSSLGFQRNMLANVGTPIVTPRTRSFASPATGSTYYGGIILDNTGNVYATGYNGLGNFGNGTTTTTVAPFQLLNQYFPGTGSRIATNVVMSGYENGHGGTIVTLRDGTMIGAGSDFRGSVPYESTPTQTPTPFWKYIPGYTPADVLY